ncbi:MAG: DsbC family protein [Brachymonas sp.]|nr:DsbC family protein [Brachymonas sp.]
MVACSQTTATAANASAGSAAAPAAGTPEAVIRQNLAQRLDQLPPIQDVRPTPMPGLYEVNLGPAGIFYTDAKGDFLIQGAMMDTQTKRNLTQERMDALNAIDFKSLPLADAIAIKNGKGTRQIAVFADPNCGYCQRFEAELKKVPDITAHVFLFPILGPDSNVKSKNIWCAKDRTKTWDDWMIKKTVPPTAECDTAALDRNLALGRQHRITGTPAIVLSSGKRIAGMVDAATLEKMLAEKP